jgi:Beta-lactamase superfamily domain
MKIETFGHAGLLLTDNNEQPLLVTDPWITGSAYWRSWWLQNYPHENQIEKLLQVKYVYITHEHPDHFHLPSIRKLGKKPTYLFPELPDISMSGFLGSDDSYNLKNMTANQWHSISENVSILSFPLWNDDSILLIDTPNAFIINLNDAKPNSKIIAQIHKVKKYLSNKKTIVLSSYSPASIVNAFMKQGERVNMKNKVDYVNYLNQINKALGADIFMPFASQAVFLRSDSLWANEYKVTFNDLQMYWDNDAILLPSYSTVDLDSFHTSYIPQSEYNAKGDKKYLLIHQREELEKEAIINAEDITNLSNKFNSARLFLAILFPKGIGISTNNCHLVYNPISGRVSQCDLEQLQENNFWLKVPAQTLKDSLCNDHFGDLAITMFIEINLNRQVKPIMIYLFFIFLTINDYQHNKSVSHLIRWFLSTVRKTFVTSPQIPIPTKKEWSWSN